MDKQRKRPTQSSLGLALVTATMGAAVIIGAAGLSTAGLRAAYDRPITIAPVAPYRSIIAAGAITDDVSTFALVMTTRGGDSVVLDRDLTDLGCELQSMVILYGGDLGDTIIHAEISSAGLGARLDCIAERSA